MAMRPERKVLMSEVRYVAATGAGNAEGGDMLCRSANGSGALLNGSLNGVRPSVTRAANPSGQIPVGALVGGVLDPSFDETINIRNWNKQLQKVGEPVELISKGWFTTNSYVGSPTAGANAYLSSSGKYTPTVHATGGLVATPLVGQFDSAPDEDGYVQITVELPRT